MSRRRNRSRQVGFGAGFGAVTGFVTGWLAVIGFAAYLLLLTVLFFRLWERGGSALLALLLSLVVGWLPFGLWRSRDVLVAVLTQWARPRLARRGVLVAEEAVRVGPFEGSVYTFWDSYGTRRYDGRSGDMRALLNRIAAHYDPDGGTSLSGLVGPGWTWTVRTFHSYDEAREVEARLIGKHFGQPGYENKRLESAA